MMIDRATWGRIVTEAALDEVGATVREDYAGRVTYGDTCVAVVGGNDAFARLIAAAARVLPDVDDLRRLAGSTCTDELGLDRVFYWPGTKISDE